MTLMTLRIFRNFTKPTPSVIVDIMILNIERKKVQIKRIRTLESSASVPNGN